jgi:hypothetical protein
VSSLANRVIAKVGRTWTSASLRAHTAYYRFVFHLRARRRGPRMTLHFGPGPVPGDRFAIWKVCQLLGLDMAPLDDTSDGVMVAWEDSTWTQVLADAINGDCVDISKGRVDEAQRAVFGYGAEIDPRTYTGQAVRKSQINTAHDGELIECPVDPEDGFVYQLLIDTVRSDGLVEDLRATIVGPEIPVTYRKLRPSAWRFENVNAHSRLASPGECFSEQELVQLIAVARELGLDFGELDVLRDRHDGRVYVVDVNKTAWGPPGGLPGRQGRRAMRLLASAFDRQFMTSAETKAG